MEETIKIYKGFWGRLGAYTIDAIIITVTLNVVFFVTPPSILIQQLLYILGTIGYFAGFPFTKLKATPGQMLLKCFTAKKDGSDMAPIDAIKRVILLMVPYMPALYMNIKFSSLLDSIHTVSPENVNELVSSPEFNEMTEMSSTIGIITFIAMIIWYLPMAFTKEKTGLHDLFSQTRVFRRIETIKIPEAPK
ncbi:MAG: RDD family protein [Alphaproteobacteria bacterium]|nr:RDD family protein [Alphaproteobacteria bacterium]